MRLNAPLLAISLTCALRAPAIDPLKVPTGLFLYDKSATWTSAANRVNPYADISGNHSGFSIWLFEPKAWVGAQQAAAYKEFRTFDPTSLTPDDHLPILRVIVCPDDPEFISAAGNSVQHVVLRSIDKKLVAQPIQTAPITQTLTNTFGAKISMVGLSAWFTLAELSRIRGASPDRDFLVTIVGEKAKSNRDFHVKRKHFFQLGD